MIFPFQSPADPSLIQWRRLVAIIYTNSGAEVT